MVLREISTPCRSNIFSCRCSGWWSANLATITCASRLAPAVLFSIGCAGLVAVFTVQSQAYFGRRPRSRSDAPECIRSVRWSLPQSAADPCRQPAQCFSSSARSCTMRSRFRCRARGCRPPVRFFGADSRRQGSRWHRRHRRHPACSAPLPLAVPARLPRTTPVDLSKLLTLAVALGVQQFAQQSLDICSAR